MIAQTITMAATGALPTPPQTLRDELVAYVAADVPDYTANLPGTLIEDVASTDVGALVVCDNAYVELINSISPVNSNLFILNQQAAAAGIPPMGFPSRTAVYCTFSGLAGYIVSQGFIVSDGTYQYATQESAVIGVSGSSSPVYCVATQDGSWSVPSGSVNALATSVPTGTTLTVFNLTDGIPGESSESIGDFRARVLQSWSVGSQGMTAYLKTLLTGITGVQQRLISVRQQSTQWEVICGGGDPYDVGMAIYEAMFYLPGLTGSVISITGISVAANAVVTTNLNHGLTTGQTGVLINGVVGTMAASINGVALTIVVLTPTTFTCGINTTGLAYTSGGVLTPNTRNVTVNLYDYPDTYAVTFVNPPMQTVHIGITWNTSSPYVVSAAAVNSLANIAVVNYINSIPVGQPINELTLEEAFKESIASVVPSELLVRLVFTYSINGVNASVVAGEKIVLSDPESYFYTTQSNVTITQG